MVNIYCVFGLRKRPIFNPIIIYRIPNKSHALNKNIKQIIQNVLSRQNNTFYLNFLIFFPIFYVKKFSICEIYFRLAMNIFLLSKYTPESFRGPIFSHYPENC